MSRLTISPDSDDRIGIRAGELDECFYTGDLSMVVSLPDGTEIPIRVTYNRPWDVSIDLPEGTTVAIIGEGDEL